MPQWGPHLPLYLFKDGVECPYSGRTDLQWWRVESALQLRNAKGLWDSLSLARNCFTNSNALFSLTRNHFPQLGSHLGACKDPKQGSVSRSSGTGLPHSRHQRRKPGSNRIMQNCAQTGPVRRATAHSHSSSTSLLITQVEDSRGCGSSTPANFSGLKVLKSWSKWRIKIREKRRWLSNKLGERFSSFHTLTHHWLIDFLRPLRTTRLYYSSASC